MNLLVDRIPELVNIGGKRYLIRTDFRISILFEMLMQDDRITEEVKIQKALDLYFPECPEDIVSAVRTVLWFYRCGQKEKRKDRAGEHGGKQIYSFDHDAKYIYAAFMTQYHIDLQDIDYLHWWKFRAMFQSLSRQTEFVRIMEYRSVEISDKMSDDQKEFYRRMKQMYALPRSDSEERRQNAIEDALIKGRGLTGLL